MLKLRGPAGLQSYSAAITMSSLSAVGLAGAPSTLIHSFLTVGTILHPSYKHTGSNQLESAWGIPAVARLRLPARSGHEPAGSVGSLRLAPQTRRTAAKAETLQLTNHDRASD